MLSERLALEKRKIVKIPSSCEQLKSWWNVCTQSAKIGCSEKMHFAVEVGHGVNHTFSFVG